MDCLEYPLAEIAPDPNQPRKVFSETYIAELAESIQARGVLQPIIITPNRDPEVPVPYLILIGECRYRASLAAGRTTIPAILEKEELPPSERVIRQLTENDFRSDLSLYERATSLARLIDSGEVTREELCQRLGRSRGWLNKMLAVAAFQGPALEAVSGQVIARLDTAARFSRLPLGSQKSLLAQARGRNLPITSAIVESTAERHRRLAQARTTPAQTLRLELSLPEIHHLLALAGCPKEESLPAAAEALKTYLLNQLPQETSA